MSQEVIKSLIAQSCGQYNTLTLQRPYIEFCGGSIEGGLFLSQLLYWADRASGDGWFYKSYAGWREEIYITEKQARAWAQKFAAAGFLETQNRKANGNPTMHYRVSWGAFISVFGAFIQGPTQGVSPFTPNGRNETSKSPKGNGQIDRKETARSTETERPDRRNVPARSTGTAIYTSTTTSNTSSNTSSNQEGRAFSASRGNFASEAEEPDQTVPVEVVQDPGCEVMPNGNDSGFTAKSASSDENVPGASATNIAPAQQKQPLGPLERQFASKSSSDPDYARFRGVYQGLCVMIDANYGVHGQAKLAWDDVSGDGLIDDDFWRGLAAYCEQKTAQFRAEGKAIGVKGAANWLRDQEWQTALARQAFIEQAADQGVDVTSPKQVRADLIQSKNRAIAEQVRRQMEAKGNA